ncbi:MAG: hypothetical protein JNG85_10475 [Spirochaetaceae bacterium]|nr:hypothetical protein [Spirochaetaceae bacterium]
MKRRHFPGTASRARAGRPLRGLGLAFALAALAAAGAAAAPAAPAAARLPALGGDTPLDRFPESDDLRTSLWKGFFAAPRDAALAAAPRTVGNEYGSWRFSPLRSGDAFYLVLAPERGGAYPLYGQGSWIVKRAADNGRFLQAKVFLRSDPGVFLRLYPAGERSRLDLVVYGGVVNREVPLPVPFERLLVSSMADIAAWSKDSVDWSLLSPRPGLYAGIRRLAEGIRARLPGLRYAEDGALDAAGRAVLIASGAPQGVEAGLNCSGFAKWVADGLMGPVEGRWLDPRALAARDASRGRSSFTSHLEASLDPFFGLDWTRNLGKALAEARLPGRGQALDENDATLEPFSLFSVSNDPVNGGPPYDAYPSYEKGVGFETRGLKPLLYVLAIKNPGSAYFASISGVDATGLRRHYHVAVLLPYFAATGEFKVDVFESAAETSLEALTRRAPKDFAHLVRFETDSTFAPPAFPGP